MRGHRIALLLLGAALAAPGAAAAAEPALEGRAVLPADTFDAGSPPSGAFTGPGNGRATPFASQPVQGFSAVLDAGDGSYLAMSDNGYGTKANSRDFLLRMYRIRPDFATAAGGSGEVAREGFVQLSDPDGHVPFPVERPDRRLTGADFDIESVRRAANGDLWFGDEFGPFLLHADYTGRLLEAPIPLPGVKGLDSPYLEEGEAYDLRASGGFEGMGLSTDGPCGTGGATELLHPMLEKSLESDRVGGNPRRRLIYEFSIAQGTYTGESWQYATERSGHYIGDLTNIDEHRLLLIERDSTEGAGADFKRVYLVDLRQTDAEGFLVKREVADLMAIDRPPGLSLAGRPGDVGLGDPFQLPFANIEALLALDRGRLLVLNDNNYPYGNGRNPDRPDDNEAVVVRIDALCDAPAVPAPPSADPPPEPPPSSPQPPAPSAAQPAPRLVPDLPGGLDEAAAREPAGPSVRAFRARPRRFRVTRGVRRSVGRARARAAGGTLFRYVLGERGRVRIRVDRVWRRRRGVRLRRVGVLSRRALLRRGSVRFSGRLGRRVLRPGIYRATITATDAAGNRGRARSVTLRVVR